MTENDFFTRRAGSAGVSPAPRVGDAYTKAGETTALPVLA